MIFSACFASQREAIGHKSYLLETVALVGPQAIGGAASGLAIVERQGPI